MAQNQQRDKPENGNPLKALSGISGIYRKYGPYLNIGYTFAASVALLGLLGYYLDKHWHTQPWLTVLGAVLGILTGFYNFFRTVAELNKKEKEEQSGR